MDPDEIGLTNLVAEEAGVEIPAPQTQTPEPQVPDTKTEENSTPAVAPEQTTPSTTEPEAQPAPSQTPEEQPQPIDWSQFLAPPEKPIEAPQPLEDGTIDPEQYKDYVVAEAKRQLREETRLSDGITQSAIQAEQILPEMKTDKTVASLVQSMAVTQVVAGQPVNLAAAAQQVRTILDQAKAAATSNAQASVTIQKNAAIETGSSQPAPDTSGADLAARINANEPEAFVELLEQWQKDGVV